ncbi:hypothetical protein [Fibrobacter sp.]|uniref:hypothetical protein n=1 Tax=Fibrobacter sp. TaxID=35828 RepID=UPI00388F4B01
MRLLNRNREDFLKCIQERLDNQIKVIQQTSDERAQKNFCKLVELMNAAIRLEQAEKRMDVNQKIAIYSIIASVFTSGVTTILVQLLI